MKKADFFLEALRAGAYRRRAWVISLFALLREGPDDWRKDPYPYRIVQGATLHQYVSPDNPEVLLPLEDAIGGQPPLNLKDRITPPLDSIINLKEVRETSYGQVLTNYVVLIDALGAKIPFQYGRLKPKQLESLILPLFTDTPPEGQPRKEDRIYPDEYVRFTTGAFQLTAFMQLAVPAATRRTMTEPPGVRELKRKLLEENKGRLHDRTVIAKIQKELNQYIRDYLKGDEGENFLIFDKSHNVVRAKLYGMLGSEDGLIVNQDADLIENSLNEGLDVKKLPSMINALRGGSFNRGVQTMMGGESVKWLLRASSNIRISTHDCGTRLGMPRILTLENRARYLGFSVVTDQGHEVLTEANYDSFKGRQVMVRSPLYCKGDVTDYCEVCMGPRLSIHPTAASTAVSEYGDTFMYMFMKAMHGKQLSTQRLDWRKQFQ